MGGKEILWILEKPPSLLGQEIKASLIFPSDSTFTLESLDEAFPLVHSTTQKRNGKTVLGLTFLALGLGHVYGPKLSLKVKTNLFMLPGFPLFVDFPFPGATNLNPATFYGFFQKRETSYILILALCLLLVIIGVALFLTLRKKKRGGPPPPPPDVEALQALELLLAEREKGLDFQEFYERMMDVLRRFLERKYELDLFEKTTSQIRKDLVRKTVPRKDEFLEIFATCDLAKFARFAPPSEEEKKMTHTCFSLLREARKLETAASEQSEQKNFHLNPSSKKNSSER